MNNITIYTDGGCDPNPGPGGWAVLILTGGKRQELFVAEPDTTNNRMELTAAINGLRAIKEPSIITLFTDSQYVQKGINEWMPKWLAKNWRGTNGPVANQDLWKELLAAKEKHQVTWRWLRGHAGDANNERVDYLTRMARNSMRRNGSNS